MTDERDRDARQREAVVIHHGSPSWDGSTTIPVEFIKWIEEQRFAIDRMDLSDITFTRDGKAYLEFKQSDIDDFRFIGLGNKYFPSYVEDLMKQENLDD